MNVLTVANLKAYYSVRTYGINREVKAVDGVSLEIRDDEIFGIAGESGCGKTTLIKVLFGSITPPLFVVGGGVKYQLDGRTYELVNMKPEEVARLRWTSIAYMPQGSMNVLNPVRRIDRSFFDIIKTHKRGEAARYAEIMSQHVQDMGLPREVLTSYPHQLSGGMRQRTTCAFATVFKPKIIFADEPTTALDVIVQRGVLQLLKDVQQEYHNTLIMVTHDMAVHANITDRMAIMYAGKIVEVGGTRDIFKDPLHPYTSFLINSLPEIGDRSKRIGAPGAPPSLASPPQGCRFNPRCPHVMSICREKTPAMAEVKPGHSAACFKLPGSTAEAAS
jgi:peptide/nickel transport system ATP-binding protein